MSLLKPSVYYAIVSVIGFVMLMSLSNANLGNFMVNDCVNIVTVLNTSSVNISILNSPSPNSQILLTNVEMTKNGNAFNYSFCNTSKVGTYTYGYIDNDGNPYSNSFEITNNGFTSTTSNGLIYLVFLLAAIGLFGITLYGALKIKWTPDKDPDGHILNINKIRYFKPFLFAMCYIELMWIFGILYSISFNALQNDSGISNLFYWAYTLMLYFLIPIAICTLLFCLIVFLQDKKLRKRIIRGYRR